MAEYKPQSHFFVDHSDLDDSVPANLATDTFGPVSGSETTKYRTTSFVRASVEAKVFAICGGQILIQPQTGDTTKVNLILKPKPSESFYPLKIKYFIYRGVNKADLIDGANLQPIEESSTDQPTLLINLWEEFVNFNQPFLDNEIIVEPLDTFPAFLIGYSDDEGTTSIERFIRRSDSTEFYQLPTCQKGEYLGRFSGRVGLDVVLDYGDHELTNQEKLFQLDLNFARKSEHIFDTTTISNSTPTKIKRYKEHIHQFIDAAAFWGSHIECGSIITTDKPNGTSENTYIFDNILNKYQTKNKIYVYIQGERARSYNFYDSIRKVYGFDPAGQLNDTNGWPILIEELTLSSTPANNKHPLDIHLEFEINGNLDVNKVCELDRHLALDIISPNYAFSTLYPKVERFSGVVGIIGTAFSYDLSQHIGLPGSYVYSIDTSSIGALPSGITLNTGSGLLHGTPTSNYKSEIYFMAKRTDGHIEKFTCNLNIRKNQISFNNVPFQINELKSCSSFSFLFSNIKQDYPLKSYYNELWPVNLSTSLSLPTDAENMVHWVTYDKNRLLNLDDVIQCGSVIQNKVLFDNGLNTNSIGPNPLTKKRRLYIASIKRNTTHNFESYNYNISCLAAGFEKQIDDSEQFADKIYNDKLFSFYQGKFTDGSIINSICLIHEGNFNKKNSYFQLGIIEEEYNRLVYDSDTVPEIMPPYTTIPQILPYDAENVFFHLEEDLNFINQNIRKFKVGLWYEDNTGNISAPLYPTSDVIVYTMDGLTFFSKEFTDYQQFFKKFANAIVEFRTIPDATINPPVPAYNGEFGFDWLRINEATLDLRPSYQMSINGGYKRPSEMQPDTEYPDDHLTYGYFYQAYKGLKKKYKSVPIRQIDEQYFIPYLTLFSQNFSNTVALSPKPPFEAHLRVYVTINEDIGKLEFDYDRSLFVIDKPSLSDNLQTVKKQSDDKTITITCLKDFSEAKQIKILCYPLGVTDKKKAQLAGLINVNKNDAFSRKEAKIAVISVYTDVNNDGIPEEAVYIPQEIENLYNILHQNLNYCDIVQGLSLDLQLDAEFKRYINPLTGDLIEGGFIYHIANNRILEFNFNTKEKIHRYLERMFLNVSGNSIYSDYYLIFAFHLTFQSTAVYGHVDEIGRPLVVLYNIRAMNPPPGNYPPRDLTTLNHEAMHAFGLYHTHKEGANPVKEPEKLFTYPKYSPSVPNPDIATDNVMSYNSKAITLWQWQKKFIKINK